MRWSQLHLQRVIGLDPGPPLLRDGSIKIIPPCCSALAYIYIMLKRAAEVRRCLPNAAETLVVVAVVVVVVAVTARLSHRKAASSLWPLMMIAVVMIHHQARKARPKAGKAA
jgi:hypothetical protein